MKSKSFLLCFLSFLSLISATISGSNSSASSVDTSSSAVEKTESPPLALPEPGSSIKAELVKVRSTHKPLLDTYFQSVLDSKVSLWSLVKCYRSFLDQPRDASTESALHPSIVSAATEEEKEELLSGTVYDPYLRTYTAYIYYWEPRLSMERYLELIGLQQRMREVLPATMAYMQKIDPEGSLTGPFADLLTDLDNHGITFKKNPTNNKDKNLRQLNYVDLMNYEHQRDGPLVLQRLQHHYSRHHGLFSSLTMVLLFVAVIVILVMVVNYVEFRKPKAKVMTLSRV